jgi:uncharacterized membrane protein YfcA
MSLIELFPLTMVDALIVCIIMTIGAAVHGSIGFGLALIVVPPLILIDPIMVPGPVIFSVLILSIMISYKNRVFIDFSGLTAAIVGRVPGAVAGATLIAVLPTTILSITLGGIVMVAVIISIIGIRVQPTVLNLFFAGTLSGFMSSTTSMGGPPMAMIYQHESAKRLRGTLGGFLIVGTIISLGVLHFAGKFGLIELIASIALLPGIFLGFFISLYTSRVLDNKYMRPAVLVFSAMTAMIVIIKNVIEITKGF